MSKETNVGSTVKLNIAEEYEHLRPLFQEIVNRGEERLKNLNTEFANVFNRSKEQCNAAMKDYINLRDIHEKRTEYELQSALTAYEELNRGKQ